MGKLPHYLINQQEETSPPSSISPHPVYYIFCSTHPSRHLKPVQSSMTLWIRQNWTGDIRASHFTMLATRPSCWRMGSPHRRTLIDLQPVNEGYKYIPRCDCLHTIDERANIIKAENDALRMANKWLPISPVVSSNFPIFLRGESKRRFLFPVQRGT